MTLHNTAGTSSVTINMNTIATAVMAPNAEANVSPFAPALPSPDSR